MKNSFRFVSAVLLLFNAEASSSLRAEEGVLSASTSDRKSEDGGSTQSSDLQEIERGCPYPEEMADDSFHCYNEDDKTFGKNCPNTHTRRIKEVFQYSQEREKNLNIREILEFPVSSLFDKSELIMGAESYELLDAHHIECLMRNGAGEEKKMLDLEDKGDLKETLKNAGIEPEHITEVYHISYCPKMELTDGKCAKNSNTASHNSKKYDREEFKETMRQICEDDSKTSFIIKPTHLSWSAGLKIVSNKDRKCEQEGFIQEVVDHVEQNILVKENRESDKHLTKLDAGFTIEELFSSGEKSTRPLEAKVQVLFGKVFEIFFVGMDPRGCTSGCGSWTIYPGETVRGWDFKGILSEEAGERDLMHSLVMKNYYEKIVNIAEKFARHVGADWTRVDMFLGGFGSTPIIKVNEVENVSGYKFPYSTMYIGNAWREAYMHRLTTPKTDGVTCTTLEDRTNGAKTSKYWNEWFASLIKMRDAFELDAPPPASAL